MEDKIQTWKRREGLMSESAWLDEGVKLYRGLIQKQPDHTEYKLELAKLLVRSGDDEKLAYVNMIKASQIFGELLNLYPNHPEALYRLGHIHYEIHNYQESIVYFSRAIKEPLSDIRMFRSYVTMAKAYFILDENGHAHHYLKQAKLIDKENNFSGEIKEVEDLFKEEGYRRVIHHPDGSKQYASLEAAELIKNDYDSNMATLDLVHKRPTFSGPLDTIPLEPKQAMILAYLIKNKGSILPKEVLIDRVWADEDSKPELSSIKTIISKINSKIKSCISEDGDNPIVSKRGQGYQWNSIDTIIIKEL